MALPKFYNLQAFFPELEQPEATILITGLEAMEGVDIWTVAGVPDIAWTMLTGGLDETHFEAVWDAVRDPLLEMVDEIPISGLSEEEEPSDEVKMMLEAIYYILLGFFAPKKREAYEIAIERILENDSNVPSPAWKRLIAIGSTDAETARPLMDLWFFHALGGYYSSMVTDYIRLHSREYVFYGRVMDEGASEPVPGVDIFCAALDEPRTFGSVTSNELGYFKTPFRVLDGIEEEATLELQFTFTHPLLEKAVIETLEFYPMSNMREPVVVELVLDEPDAQSNTILSTGIELPADVVTYLGAQSITVETLADIRVLGGLKNLPTDSINKSDPDLLKLDGLAALEVLSMDVEVTGQLYDRGYSGLGHVTQQARGPFVSENTDILGDLGAARLHYQARAAQLYALNTLAAAHNVLPDGKGTPTVEHPSSALPGSPCNCPDCSSALSPLAYLADLLQFTTTNLKYDNDGTLLPITLDMLEEASKQRFKDLNTDCDQLKQGLCQNRIATEVLRAHVADLTLEPGQSDALLAAEKEYLMQTYELLLNKLGTSYTELRQARALDPTDDVDDIKRITNRLGIIWRDGLAPTLELLRIDLSNPGNIVEGINDVAGAAKSLEGLFGLRDSKRDPLEETPESDVERWKKARLREIWVDQHKLKNNFWDTADRQVIIDPDVVTVDDLRTPEDANMAFNLWRKRRNWLDALPLDISFQEVAVPLIDHRANGNVIVLYAANPVQAEELFDAIVSNSDPENATEIIYANGGFTQPYRIRTKSLVDDRVELSLHETIEVDRGGGTISWVDSEEDPWTHPNTVFRTFLAPNLTTIFELMLTDDVSYTPEDAVSVVLTPNWATPIEPAAPTIDNLFEALRGVAQAVRSGALGAADSLWNEFHLVPDELLWLVDFLDTYEGYPIGVHSENNHDLTKWSELRDILVNVFKRLANEFWRAEENDQDIALDPRDFWVSVTPPRPGPWPILEAERIPLIDPELISVRDLPEISVRKAHVFSLPQVPDEEPEPEPEDIIAPAMVNTDALEVFISRREAIADARVAIEAVLIEQEDFMAMLDRAFNDPSENGLDYTWAPEPPLDPEDNTPPSYLALLEQLTSATTRDEATTVVENTFRITADEFIFVVGVGTRRFTGQPVPQRDLDRLFGILTGAYKRIVLYPAWVTQERSDDLMVEVDEVNEIEVQQQWKLRKAALPRWRASAEQRNTWLNALAEHNERPIIDADLIGPGDILNPIEGQPAFDLWDARWIRMHGDAADFPLGGGNGWLFDVGGFALDNNNDLKLLTQTFLGHAEEDLAELREQQEDGIDIRPRLAQLNLSPAEYNQILVCRDILVADPGTLTGEEKTSIQRILAGVQAKRHRFEDRLAEQTADITLSQDFFIIREQPIVSFPPQVEYPLTPWLAAERDLLLWRKELSGNLQQEKSALDAWQQTLFEVDEAMVVHLRDALVRASGDPSRSLVQNARDLGDRFLIDLENNCCYKTNRIAVAIESFQQMLWKTRTGDILQHYPEIRYVGGNFDEAWTWMGSYANWRAAMFVFLYPENVLHPSLRKEGTPAFREVLNATRNNRRFDPHAACEVVHAHGEYMKDISSLELSCSIVADLFLGADCGVSGSATKKVNFVFARSNHSGKVYYTTSINDDPSNVVQHQFWTAVPGVPDDVLITGCDYYVNEDREVHHVYLFYMPEKREDRDRFFAMRFDVQTGQWESEPLEFELELDDLRNDADQSGALSGEHFVHLIESMTVAKNSNPGEITWFAISLLRKNTPATQAARYVTFVHHLEATGKELASEEWWDRWRTSMDPAGLGAWQVWSGLGDSLIASLEGRIKDYYRVSAGTGNWLDDLSFFLLQHNDLGRESTKVIRMRPRESSAPRYQVMFSTSTSFFNPGLPTEKFIHQLLVDFDRRWVLGLASNAYDSDIQPDEVLVFTEEAFEHTSEISVFQLPDFWVQEDVPAMGCKVAFTGGSGPYAAGFVPLWYQRRTDGHIRLAEVIVNEAEEPDPPIFTWGPDKLRVTPKIQPPAANVSGSTTGATGLGSIVGWLHNVDNNPKLLECFWETFYFVPMQVALQLQTNGHYLAALDRFNRVYDRNLPIADRKIFHGLRAEETITFNATRLAEWYADPLNPHAIAAIRPHTYTRYTIMAIAQCLLDYADAEFTTDSSETVPRARELYEDALDLLNLLAPPHNCPIRLLILTVENSGIPAAWLGRFVEALELLEPVTNTTDWPDIVEAIETVLSGSALVATKFAAIATIVNDALGSQAVPTIEQLLEVSANNLNAATSAGLASAEADAAITSLSQSAAHSFEQVMLAVTGLDTEALEGESIPWFADATRQSGFEHAPVPDMVTLGLHDQMIIFLQGNPAGGFLINDPYPNIWLSGVPFSFCVVPNPIVGALVMKAEVELWKIHNCMNIAGMVRELDPFAASTDSTTGVPTIGPGGGTLAVPNARSVPPSAYRYRVLVDRARQLVGMAQQVEAAFLSTLEKLDAERYSQLRAEQDIATSKATIKLQDLKVNEANSGVELAEMQKERAKIQYDYFDELMQGGINDFEALAMDHIKGAIGLQYTSATMYAIAALFPTFGMDAGNSPRDQLSIAAQGVGALASALSTQANLFQTIASYQRRAREWDFQRSLANQDLNIGNQQIKLAKDRVRIVGQERTIAVLQNDHAKATLDFLKNKFTSAELYEWMSKVLEDAYAWFLQEATAMAILAQRQLAFERQIDLPPFVRTDYWVVDGGSMGGVDMTGQGVVDRRGLTGSTRLLKDLSELDQYAFNTNSPKLQLSKTISLNEIAPEELMALRDHGIANFRTRHELFDRDYPGHYLRLIKKVNVTVIALNPPTKGIRATLTNGGVSRVYTGGTIFQERVINRYPEQIALSGGVSDYGVFQLHGEGEFLNPFEGTGVDTQWEFRMEKAANPFDYGSIADVLITIEYEAMNSFLWRNTVVQRLNNEPTTAGLAISMKNNLPDQWFDLHNPEQTETPYEVSFQISERDLVPNINGPLNIDRLLVYVLMKDGEEFAHEVTIQHGESVRPASVVDGIARFPDGVVPNTGPGPLGEWSIAFDVPTGSTLPNPFNEENVDDIVIVFTYSGDGSSYSF
jgi:hypothetical protein